ncbi:MAG: Gx transporter family protein [Ruminococcus sp.]|nr:Gx transporter family protein [Ruminococcus sp.]
MNTKKLTYMSLLTAMALIIFVIELQIPPLFPIPGAKLGLANIVTVFAVYTLRPAESAMILTARILLGTLIAGSPISLIMSLSGGFLCLAGMLLLCRVIDKQHIWVCSVLGAVLHNLGQTAAAMLVMGTASVLVYLPFLMLTGCAAGLFTGLCAQYSVRALGGRFK